MGEVTFVTQQDNARSYASKALNNGKIKVMWNLISGGWGAYRDGEKRGSTSVKVKLRGVWFDLWPKNKRGVWSESLREIQEWCVWMWEVRIWDKALFMWRKYTIVTISWKSRLLSFTHSLLISMKFTNFYKPLIFLYEIYKFWCILNIDLINSTNDSLVQLITRWLNALIESITNLNFITLPKMLNWFFPRIMYK